MKMKTYIAPEFVIVDLENEDSVMMTMSVGFNAPGDNTEHPEYQPEAASRRGSDWDEYFGR